jgi:hypothetical protein
MLQVNSYVGGKLISPMQLLNKRVFIESRKKVNNFGYGLKLYYPYQGVNYNVLLWKNTILIDSLGHKWCVQRYLKYAPLVIVQPRHYRYYPPEDYMTIIHLNCDLRWSAPRERAFSKTD